MSFRQIDDECSSNTRLPYRIEQAFVVFNNFFTNRQTNARPVIRTSAMQSLEYLKNAVFELLIKPDTIIRNRNVRIIKTCVCL